MDSIAACLWFDGQAEEAAKFYTSIFPRSKVGRISRYRAGAPRPKGSVLTVTFTLDGLEFVALNGGPQFKFTEAVSFVVNCDTQKEIDRMWAKLSAGGEQVQCGWLKDKFGLSWQIVPTSLQKMITDKNARRADRVMQAVLAMKKIEIKELERAFAGKA